MNIVFIFERFNRKITYARQSCITIVRYLRITTDDHNNWLLFIFPVGEVENLFSALKIVTPYPHWILIPNDAAPSRRQIECI